jgi:hypothetical protein
MTRQCKLALVALLLSAFTSALAATTKAAAAPKVLFVGDWITTTWGASYSPNSSWTFVGSGAIPYSDGDSGYVANELPGLLVTYKPNIVHVMCGLMDEEATDDASRSQATQDYLTNIQTIVKEVKAANAQVILSLEPGGWSPENAVIAAYGAQNNILVLGYEGVPMQGSTYFQGAYFIPLAAGYDTMNQIVTEAIATLNNPIQGGYLQNELEQSADWQPQANVNTWTPGAVIQFTAIGYAAGGVIYPQINTNLIGSSAGTWTSSNPLVGYIGPTGLFWTLTPGKTTVKYTTASGIVFSEWIMTVENGIP